jgi:hypothetical protein
MKTVNPQIHLQTTSTRNMKKTAPSNCSKPVIRRKSSKQPEGGKRDIYVQRNKIKGSR